MIDVSSDGFGFVRGDRFQSGFAADLDDAEAAFLRDSQVPIRMSAFGTKLTSAAWRTKPSWAIIPSGDCAFGEGMLLGMARRIGAAISEIPGSHAAYITQSSAIADRGRKRGISVCLDHAPAFLAARDVYASVINSVGAAYPR